ncbi:hypothetical protein BGZ60DRAFT_147869 [Tricladium varicosporioides]|nr:hypothetical protein BGZ60DRAFT_147869 [Hymenoscyphus varicosporioides]
MGHKPSKITKQWADSPFALLETPRKRLGITDPKKASGAVNAATEMALVHNFIIRILNCIYLQAPNVKLEEDIKDFSIFMYAWCILIHEHHTNEENLFFPWLEEYIGVPKYMEKNVAQHHAFAPGMEKFEDYVKAVKEGKERFDAEKVRGLIDDFGSILTQHLKEEIESLEGLGKFGDKVNWEMWNKRVSDHAVKTAEKEHEVPVVLTNMDFTFESPIHDSVWPPFPWFVQIMFRWLYLPKHKGAWRFSCCDWYGIPKELEFV